MSRYYSYINSAKEIISAYDGKEPFASFLKKHFSANKKYGSKDRKQIAHLCYCRFRLGKLFNEMEEGERLQIALLLCSSKPNDLLQHLKPAWNENISSNINEKLKLIGKDADVSLIFPFTNELSNGVDAEKFCLSHFIQPDLFLRIRPGQQQNVINKLSAKEIPFKEKNTNCIALTNSAKIEEIIQLNKEAVVQDYSSQRVGELLQHINSNERKISVWDCCAASGGKSIMAKDILGDIELTVSDVRESILINLKKRFAEAGIKKYTSTVTDLTHSPFTPDSNRDHHSPFDLIIADVPCSGSGTWGRTPEQLSFLQTSSIDQYAQLQKKIAANVIPQLKENGYLLYITCSVFKKENEEVVAWLQQQASFELIEMKLLKGYEQKADTMFAALLKRK